MYDLNLIFNVVMVQQKAIGMSVLRLIWWMQRLPQTLSYCFQATVILIWLWSALICTGPLPLGEETTWLVKLPTLP